MFINLFDKSLQSGGLFHDWTKLESPTERALWVAQQDPKTLEGLDAEFEKSWVWSPRAQRQVPVGLVVACAAAWVLVMGLGLPAFNGLPLLLLGAVGWFATQRALGLRQEMRAHCAPMNTTQLLDVVHCVDDHAEVRALRDSLISQGHKLRAAHGVALEEKLQEVRRAELMQRAAGRE